jgi:energy coupling factor transporter S component ThiW
VASTRHLALAALLAAIPVVLSFVPGSIPVAGARLLPWQHMANVIAGVLLGPWWAVGAATVAAILRNVFGVGTLFAFPGSIPGALIVGLAHMLWRRPWVGLLEPIGTAFVGATVAAFVVAPTFMGREASLKTLFVAFLASSIPGAILGVVLLLALMRAGVAATVRSRP